MTESNQKPAAFLGTYFDRDNVLRLARWADILSWVTLTLYIVAWLLALLQLTAQFYNGLLADKGTTPLMMFNIFSPILLQPLPGIALFFGLQAISKFLLILLDVEDNTRRSAR